MSKILARMKAASQLIALNAVAWLRTMLATEPARVRAAVMSGVVALAVFVPALANSNIAGQVTGVVLFLLQIVMGEQTRSRVTPVGKE
ncbi:hypothetical protein ACFVHB_20090 [Kitasatospora sp. NPDC127111]|uniref:hypothetical protein n=1 Tax=Kitasatospora sp. NPDC127111 TaxID=3345363 RepID=UPI0036396C7B